MEPKPYVYRPLQWESSIRVLALLPGEFGSPLQCSLVDASLQKEISRVGFTALSYAWGDDSPRIPRFPIVVRGARFQSLEGRPLQVRAMLKRHIRPQRARRSRPQRTRRNRNQRDGRSRPQRARRLAVCQPRFTPDPRCKRRLLEILPTLWEALKNLRSATEIKVLWVDAVCIDQKNISERNQQVGIMGKIYQAACETCVWLGPADDDSDLAFDWAVSLYKEIIRELKSREQSAVWAHLEKAERIRKSLEDFTQACQFEMSGRLIYAIMLTFWGSHKRKWWERLWVVQEVVLSKNVWLACGSTRLRWVDLEFIAAFVFSHLNASTSATPDTVDFLLWYILRTVYNLGQLRSNAQLLQNRVPNTLEQALSQAVGRKCKNQLDHVYAVLSLCEFPTRRIIPDYTKSIEQVLMEATLVMILDSNCLDPICTWPAMGHSKYQPFSGASWVRDITREKNTSWFDCNASKSGKIDYELGNLQEEGILQFQAVLCDTVASMAQPLHMCAPLDKMKHRLGRIRGHSESGTNDGCGQPYPASGIAELLLTCRELDDEQFLQWNPEGLLGPRNITIHDHIPDHFVRALVSDTFEEKYSAKFGKFPRRLFNPVGPEGESDIWGKYDFARVDEHVRVYHEVVRSGKVAKTRDKFRLQGSQSSHSSELNYRIGSNFHGHFKLMNETGWRFCRTAAGRFGWVPSQARIGDQIYVVYGSKAPMILRPYAVDQPWQDRKAMKLVGGCFIQGIMDGEIIDEMEQNSESGLHEELIYLH